MADKILLEVEIEDSSVTAAVTEIQKAREAIDQLKASNKALAEQGQTNSAQFIKNEQDIKTLNKTVSENSTVIQANNQLQKAQKDSIDSLRAANSLLLKEKNSLSTTDEASKKRIAEINTLYDKNTKTINDNSSSTEKQKMNIGNYGSALDKLVPGLGSFTQGLQSSAEGFKSMTLQALKFIATPIGAIIAAVVLAVAALAQYFTRTEEGGDMLAKTMAQLGAILNVITDRVTQLGGALVKLFTGDFTGAADAAGKAVSGVADEMQREWEAAGRLAEILDKLEDRELSYGVAASETTNRIKQLLIEAKNRTLSEQQRIDLLQKATDLEVEQNKTLKQIRLDQLSVVNQQIEQDFNQLGIQKKLSESEIEFAKRIVDNGEITVAARKKVSDAIIAFNQVEGESLDLQEKIAVKIDQLAETAEQKRLKRIEDEKKAKEKQLAEDKKYWEDKEKLENKFYDDSIKAALKSNQDQIDAMNELNKLIKEEEDKMIQGVEDRAQTEINILKNQLLEGKISRTDYNQEVADLELAAMQAELEVKKQFGQQDLQLQGQITDASIAIKEKEAQAKVKQDQIIMNSIGQVASVFGKNTLAFKVLASAQALISTYSSAVKAYEDGLSVGGPAGLVLGPVAAAAAALAGLANVARINAVTFEDGGVIPIQGKSHSQGGENVAIGNKIVGNVQGGEHMVVLKRGAYSIFEQLSRANELAGGVAFAQDRAPRRYLADGGFVARTASPSTPSNDQLASQVSEAIGNLKIYTRTTELAKVQANVTQVQVLSELR